MTTISSVQEFTCNICDKRFDTRSALERHENKHSMEGDEGRMRMPSARTIAIAGGIAAGVVVAGIIAWRLARRRSRST